MGKIIFCAVIVGMCFGQGILLKENYKIALPAPIDVSMKSAYGGNAIVMKNFSFYSSNHTSQLNNLHYLLLSQVEGDSLKTKTSFWKQAGIYGLEAVGAECTTCISAYLSWNLFFRNVQHPLDPEYFDEWLMAEGTYLVLNSFLSTSSTWIIAQLFNQKGNWKKSFIGVSIGSFLNILFINMHLVKDCKLVAVSSFTLPSIGAVVGYNW